MIHVLRRVKEAAGMALSDDLRKRVVDVVVVDGLSRNAAARRFGVSIARRHTLGLALPGHRRDFPGSDGRGSALGPH